MIDRVEKLCQVDIHRDSPAVIDIGLHLLDRLVCVAARSTSPAGAQDSRRLVPRSGMRKAHKAETRFRKRRIENRREHLGDGLLNHSVGGRGRFANSPSKRLPPSALGISTLRTACGRYRPASICSRCAGRYARAWAGQSCTVTPPMPDAPLLDFTRCHARASWSLASTACSRSWFIASSGFKARCVPLALASSRGGLIVANPQCAFGRHRLRLVSRSEALQWPDAWTHQLDIRPFREAW